MEVERKEEQREGGREEREGEDGQWVGRWECERGGGRRRSGREGERDLLLRHRVGPYTRNRGRERARFRTYPGT